MPYPLPQPPSTVGGQQVRLLPPVGCPGVEQWVLPMEFSRWHEPIGSSAIELLINPRQSIPSSIAVIWGDGSSEVIPWPATSRQAPRLRHLYSQRADVSVQVQLGMLIATLPVALLGCPVPPQQLLYRLSRIVLLGLVLYTAWLLVTLQPDLARRMATPAAQSLQEQVRARQSQVQTLLRRAIDTNPNGLHTLALLQWDGCGSVTVLAADGQLALTPGQQPLLDVEIAMLLLCPVGCSTTARRQGLLLGLYEPDPPTGGLQTQHRGQEQQQSQRKQLQLIAQQLGELLGAALSVIPWFSGSSRSSCLSCSCPAGTLPLSAGVARAAGPKPVETEVAGLLPGPTDYLDAGS
jgi:hypothetical protein